MGKLITSLMNNRRYFLILHFASIAVSLITLYLIDEKDYARWDLDWKCFMASILFAAICLPLSLKSNFWLKFYLISYIIMSILPSYFISSIKSTKLAESTHYTIRKDLRGGVSPHFYNLYVKDGLTEKFLLRVTDDNTTYNVTDFHIYEEISAVTCKSTLTEKWKRLWEGEYDTASFYIIVPIDQKIFDLHTQEIDSIKRRLNICTKEGKEPK